MVPCRVAVGHPGRQGPELLGNHRDVGDHCFSNEPSWGDLSTDGLMWDRYDGRMNKIWFKYNFIISRDQVYFPALFSLFILVKEAIVKVILIEGLLCARHFASYWQALLHSVIRRTLR